MGSIKKAKALEAVTSKAFSTLCYVNTSNRSQFNG
nr:MAG TPA: hypothetical protein [Caudoviricetes sp.]